MKKEIQTSEIVYLLGVGENKVENDKRNVRDEDTCLTVASVPF